MLRHDTFKTIQSERFPGHSYRLLEQTGQGGMGTVYTVKLVNDATEKAIAMYACKVVLKSFIQSKNTEKREIDLQREI